MGEELGGFRDENRHTSAPGAAEGDDTSPVGDGVEPLTHTLPDHPLDGEEGGNTRGLRPVLHRRGEIVLAVDAAGALGKGIIPHLVR